MLLQLLQLALGALVLLDQLLGAHGDAQQARLVEDVVGIAESLAPVTVRRGGVVVSVQPVQVARCPEFIHVEGQGVGACQEGERRVLAVSRVGLVAGRFKDGDGFGRGLRGRLRAGGAVEPVAAAVSPLSLIVDGRRTGPRGSQRLGRQVSRVRGDLRVGLEDGHVAFGLSEWFRGSLWRGVAV